MRCIKSRIFILFLCMLSIYIPLSGKDFEFYREDLTFTLTKSHLNVDGLYYFRNQTDKPLSYMLFYPYPADSLMGTVDSTFAFNENGMSCKINDKETGMSFGVKIAANDTTVCRVGYRQALKGHSARYILLTTHSWGQPFEQVTYIVVSPLKHLKFNYQPNSKIKKGKYWKYSWHKTNFMPDKDFIVRF